METIGECVWRNVHAKNVALEKFLNCFTIILCRTSLSGVDLNRRWDNPNKSKHPTIYNCKMMCKRFQKARDIILSCDIHGHSRKEGPFMYGCQVTTFPDLFDVQCEFFSKAKCTFKVEVRKQKNIFPFYSGLCPLLIQNWDILKQFRVAKLQQCESSCIKNWAFILHTHLKQALVVPKGITFL